MPTIPININCELCDEHRTALGILESSYQAITDSKLIADDCKLEVWKCYYEQICADRRTRMIQGFKKDNIKDIRNER